MTDIDNSGTDEAVEAAEQVDAPAIDYTGQRRVLRYKPSFDNDGTATILVGDEPKVVHAGTGTSPTVSVWVEVDGSTADATEIRLASVATGAAVPEGGEHIGMFVEFTLGGPVIRHLYRLP